MNLKYNIIIEATGDPNYFGYYSPDIPRFTGRGNSIPSLIDELEETIKEHLDVMRENGRKIPAIKANPKIIIQN